MPPANVAVGDIAQCVIRTNTASPVNLNVLHYRCYNVPTNPAYGPAMTALAEAVASGPTSIAAAMRACMSSEWTTRDVTVQRIRPVRDYYQRIDIGGAGTFGDEPLPPNVDLVINKHTDATGRGRTGRFYQGGLDRGQTTIDSYFTEPFLGGAVAVLRARLATPLIVSGDDYVWKPVVIQSGSNGYSLIRNCTANRIVRVMNRRTKGHGI